MPPRFRMAQLRQHLPHDSAGLFFVLGGDVVSKALMVVTSIVIVKFAATTEMGIFAIFLAAHNILVMIIDAGLNVSLVSHAARVELDFEHRLGFIKAGLWIKIGLAIVVLLPAYLLCPYVCARLHAEQFMVPFRYACLAAVGSAALSFSASCYQSMQQFKALSLVRASEGALRCAGVLTLLLARGFDLTGIMAVYAWSPLLVGSVAAIRPLRTLRGAVWSRREIMTVLGFSRWVLVSTVSNTIALQLDVVLLSSLSTVAAVGSYGAAQRLVTPLQVLLNSITTFLLPKAMQRRAADQLRAFQARAMRTTLPIAVATAACAAAATPFVFRFLPQYPDGPAAFLILALALSVSLVLNPSALLLYSLDRPDLVAWANVGQLAVALACNLVLIPTYGVAGAALSAALTWTSCAVAYFLLARHQLSRTGSPAQRP